MARFIINVFHVRNFFCLFSLRAGTLITLYLTMAGSWFFLLLWLNLFQNYTRSSASLAEDPVMLLLGGVSIFTIIISGCNMWKFPEMNKKYDKNAINVKLIKYFFMYNCFLAAMGLFSGFLFSLNVRIFDTMIGFAILSILCTGLFLHFAAVAYSFYLSILKPDDEPLEYEELTANNLNAATARFIRNEKLSNNDSQSKPTLPPIPNPVFGDCSSGGNLYVEIPHA